MPPFADRPCRSRVGVHAGRMPSGRHSGNPAGSSPSLPYISSVTIAGPATWRSSRRKRLEAAVIAGVGAPLVRGWARTLRFEIDGAPNISAAQAIGHPIPAFWHGRILPSLMRFRGLGVGIMISESFDGEWITRIAAKLGFRVVRGSNSRAARRGALQMAREIRNHPMAVALDGPRGPRGVAKPGAAWLSKSSGHPILPFHAEASRGWTLRSWDRTLVPAPFARVVLSFAEPFVVPPDADGDLVALFCRRIEESLRLCEARCHERLGRPLPDHLTSPRPLEESSRDLAAAAR
jgi:lysophospholipid acyltransferase (LPLAT)-like uncharacterized protein